MEKIVIELKQSDFDGDLSKNNPLSVCNAIFIIKTDITKCLCQQNDANPVLSASGTYYLSFDPYNEPVITKL